MDDMRLPVCIIYAEIGGIEMMTSVSTKTQRDERTGRVVLRRRSVDLDPD